MQMTEAFAGAVTVSIPIFALAAGTEARALRDRLKQPDHDWEHAMAYFRDLPGLSKRYMVERVMAIASAIVWLGVFVVLTIAEIRCLVWMADGAQPGNSGLAARRSGVRKGNYCLAAALSHTVARRRVVNPPTPKTTAAAASTPVTKHERG
ncbi:MAG TPA: hypothetical protein VJT16_13490 [Streptosporangiaceae bacterium]|jgi:hypothetical protein|nr:hypothetical protein [Streptosporangiaceae bacterium]